MRLIQYRNQCNPINDHALLQQYYNTREICLNDENESNLQHSYAKHSKKMSKIKKIATCNKFCFGCCGITSIMTGLTFGLSTASTAYLHQISFESVLLLTGSILSTLQVIRLVRQRSKIIKKKEKKLNNMIQREIELDNLMVKKFFFTTDQLCCVIEHKDHFYDLNYSTIEKRKIDEKRLENLASIV
jgi:hypothetical protein